MVAPIEKGGGFGAPATFQNEGTGPNKGRQEGRTCTRSSPTGTRASPTPATWGRTRLLVYPARRASSLLDRTKTHPGAGPRHFAFGKDGRFAYVNNELDNTVVAYAVDETGPLTALQTLSTLPEGFSGTSHTAEIAVHPSGRWLYVSNRGHDSLAVFGIEKDGTLVPVEIKAPGLKEPRGFEIDPSGRWLVVGGQNSDELLSLPIDPQTGRLGEVAGRAKMSKPVCVVFRRADQRTRSVPSRGPSRCYREGCASDYTLRVPCSIVRDLSSEHRHDGQQRRHDEQREGEVVRRAAKPMRAGPARWPA